MKKLKFSLALFLICSIFFEGKGQSFSFELTGDSIGYGAPGGNDITLEGKIINTGTTDLEIDIIRAKNILPGEWASYICVDVCFSPFTDSARLYLPAGQTQVFKFSFITSSAADTGKSMVNFINVYNESNAYSTWLYGITSEAAGIGQAGAAKNGLAVFPNPVANQLVLTTSLPLVKVECYNAEGRNIKTWENIGLSPALLDVSGLPEGVYFISAFTGTGKVISNSFIKD